MAGQGLDPRETAGTLAVVLELLRETWLYLRTSKRWWLLPLILIPAALGGLVLVLEGLPFLYPLF
jgi:hypothetical protein